MSISNERQNEILGNALDWFSEHYDQNELLNILHDKLGMTDSETIPLGLILIKILKMKKISQ